MNQTLFECWIIDQLNQNEDTQKTKINREKKKPNKKQQQNQKEMNELEALFSQLTISDKKQKQQKQQSILKIDFEQLSDISSIQDEEFLKWLFSQLRLHFSQRKVCQVQPKIDSLFNLFFDEKEIDFLQQGICARLGIENDFVSIQESRFFLKNIFNNIFEV